MHRFLCTLLMSIGAVTAVAAQDIMPLAEIEPGLQGYGLSVFSGQQPERFEVEVLGVWKQVAPDTSFILARLSGMNLEVSGVVAGMSGSPVYLDGRLAGAVSFAWPFSIEPIAGITPIEAMHRLRDVPVAGPQTTLLREPVTVGELVSGEFGADLLERSLERLFPAPIDGASSGIAWSAVGFGASSRDFLARSLGAVVPAGRVDNLGTEGLVAGGSVAAVLVDGDLQLAATGTVTERTQEEVLAFGHPFLSIGALELPMATSEVITVLSNRLSSFKIANLGRVVGAFDLDRKSGIRGRMGQRATMTPLNIEIEGDRSRKFEMQVARIPMMSPTLVAVSVLGALDSVTQAGGAQGLDLEVRFELVGHDPLEINQSFDGETAGTDTAMYVLAFADYLMNNHLEEVDVSRIDVALTQHQEPRLATLVDAHASKTLVRPGEEVSLNLELTEYRGERRRAALELQIPTSIPDGRYSLLIGDGVSIDVARMTIEQSAPVTFGQALDLLNSLHSRRQLVVLGVFGGRGLAVSGEVMPQLPASIRSLWGAASSSSAIPLQLAIAQQEEKEMELPFFGAVRIDLEIRRDGPIGPEPPAESTEVGRWEAAGSELQRSGMVREGSR